MTTSRRAVLLDQDIQTPYSSTKQIYWCSIY